MQVFIASHNIISSLGFSSDENFSRFFAGQSGIQMLDEPRVSAEVIPASVIDRNAFNKLYNNELKDNNASTYFEKLMLLSAHLALKNSGIDASAADTLFILSTTKGNVELLADENPGANIHLWHSAQLLREHFHNPNEGIVVSNACISGISATILGMRLIQSGQYNHVVVVGADVLSKFVVAGFQSFHSLSGQACRPFDKDRDGLTLGEGAATIVLTNQANRCQPPFIEMVSGATSNDANHISGPSRTGEGLLIAIEQTLKGFKAIDLISAHGTATPYNDDMESKAISRAGLSHVPVNSLKGYIGHTLGAAGIIETVAHVGSLVQNHSIGTVGYREFGVAENIAIEAEGTERAINHVLKLASGFGGCNAALLLKKHA
jgi:3-oxoacyl-[acyl-carrier-protein] synthase-1